MIIESGIDVIQVLRGSLGFDDPRGLWIIAMDEGLRLLYVEPVLTDLVGGVDEYVDDIEMFLDGENTVQYFALAWSTDEVREREPGWLRALDDRLRELLSLRGRRLLGQLVFDPHTMFSSVPRCDFSLEPDLQDLPRALAIGGPHGLDCPCPPCAADRRDYDEPYDYEPYDYEPYDYDYGYDETGLPWPGLDDTAPGDYSGRPPWLPPRQGRFPARAGDRARGIRALDRVGRYTGQAEVRDEPRYDPVWNRWYPDPARAYKRWTFDEEVEIARSHFAGLSCFDISILVSRQPSAVASRLNKLGISSRTVVVETTPVVFGPLAVEPLAVEPPATEPRPPDR